MNRLKIIFISAISCVCYLSVAQAADSIGDASTAALVSLCENQNDQDAQNFCFGFGEGVYQAFLLSRPRNAKVNICIADIKNSREMILREFLQWSKEHPQFNQEKAAKTLIRFLTHNYSCR